MASDIVHKLDRFNGVLIKTSEQTLEGNDFVAKLKEAVSEWTSKGKRGVWITLPTRQSALLPLVVELGFDFHHAQSGYVCLTKWLPDDIPNHLPGYANHFVGVGGFVVNTSNQLLVIREIFHVFNTIAPWKLPGGMTNSGEDVGVTAQREVLEETGIDSTFVCVLAFRHMHHYRHGCSDIYVVCLMKALTTELKPCPLEIADCKWMDLEEYESLESISEVNRYFVKKYKEYLSTGHAVGVEQVLSFDRKSMQNVYSVQRIGPLNYPSQQQTKSLEQKSDS